MADLEKAIAIAVEAHREQRDKAGHIYILHPLRVMLRLSKESDMIVAVLHDVVEDSKTWTLDKLRAEGFGEEILAALDGVTRRGDESYEEFIDRAATNPISKRVKLADLEDNMDVRRLTSVADRDAARLTKYIRAWQRLQEL